MKGRSKIQNEQEVLRWFNEGRPYSWMVEEYRRKYNIETTIAMWGNFRSRRGLDRRLDRSPELIPWQVNREHRWAYPLMMLRAEARRRRGEELRESDKTRLISWRARLVEGDLVVHYDPDTPEGFFLVPRRPGVDHDLIRDPGTVTSIRWEN